MQETSNNLRGRKILSFDVGIKNLAFCLMEINDIEHTFKILLWDIINLATSRKTCCALKQNGELCESVATYIVSLTSSTYYYYCSAHINRAEFNTMNVDIHVIELESDELDGCAGDPITGVACHQEGLYTTNILEGNYCKRHMNKRLAHENIICVKKGCSRPINRAIYTLDQNTCDTMNNLYCGWCGEHFEHGYDELIKKKTKKISQNCNKISLDRLACSMYEQLDRIPKLMEADEVYVENQPTFINPTMKTISSMLYGYFILRGIYERARTNSNITNVSFCSPSNKLKVGGDHSDKKLNETDKPRVYRMTKNLGINYCKKLIEDDHLMTDHLMKYKKKDDLCDSFLQAFVMIFNPMPHHYFLKLQPLLESPDDPNQPNERDKTKERDQPNERDQPDDVGKKTRDKKGNTFYFGKKKYHKKVMF